MNKNKLIIKWSKKEKDFSITYPHKADGHFISELLKPWKMILRKTLYDNFWKDSGYNIKKEYQSDLGEYHLLEKDWLKDLEKRGYDLTTLKFEIKLKEESK